MKNDGLRFLKLPVILRVTQKKKKCLYSSNLIINFIDNFFLLNLKHLYQNEKRIKKKLVGESQFHSHDQRAEEITDKKNWILKRETKKKKRSYRVQWLENPNGQRHYFNSKPMKWKSLMYWNIERKLSNPTHEHLFVRWEPHT